MSESALDDFSRSAKPIKTLITLLTLYTSIGILYSRGGYSHLLNFFLSLHKLWRQQRVGGAVRKTLTSSAASCSSLQGLPKCPFLSHP